VSVYEYWIGKGVDVAQAWLDYEAGEGYEHKFYDRTCHLLEIEFDVPVGHPIFPFEAIFKTTKRYFHDLKEACLPPSEYDRAAPLYFYGVQRGSAIWQWLVRCPGHNITAADPSDNYETETVCAGLDRRST